MPRLLPRPTVPLSRLFPARRLLRLADQRPARGVSVFSRIDRRQKALDQGHDRVENLLHGCFNANSGRIGKNFRLVEGAFDGNGGAEGERAEVLRMRFKAKVECLVAHIDRAPAHNGRVRRIEDERA